MTVSPSRGHTCETAGDGVMREAAARSVAGRVVWIQNNGTVHERTAMDTTVTLCGRNASPEDECARVAVRPCWTCVRIYVAAEPGGAPCV